MKLKNSYILIAMAIFLLISIGSVCASENITADSDVQLADDGTDVVLSEDTDENVMPDDTQEQINTTVETDKTSYEFKQDDSNKNFTVNVKNNESKNINVAKDDLNITDGNRSILFDYDNSIITITEQLTYGNYNFTITYLGNDTYVNSSTIVSVKIYGNTTIETVTSVVCNGKDIEIPVNVTDQADYIDLVKDNFNLTLVYTNETGNVSNLTISEFDIVNDTIKFTMPNNVKLNNASLIINYTNATEPKTVDIKVSTEVKAVKDNYEFKSEQNKSISISIVDGQENQLNVKKTDLKVFDNGKEITDFTLNNTNLTLKLDVGVHYITITYLGNETYNASTSGAIRINVTGNNTLDVPDSVVATNGSSVEIPINLTDGVYDNTYLLNASNTNVTYNGNNISIDWDAVKDTNKLIITLTNGIVPTTVTINYTENGKSIVKSVLVKFSTTVVIPESINITEGDNATFPVQVNGADGVKINITGTNLTISTTGGKATFNKTSENITVTGLKKGIYNVTITYKGNGVNNTSKAYISIYVRGAAEINTNGTAVNVNSTKKGEIQIINITNGVDTFDFTKDDFNLTVTYKDGNVTKNITITNWNVVNGTISFELENANFTTAILTINYTTGNAINNITLNRIYNVIIDLNNTVNYYQDGEFKFRLLDVDNNNEPVSGKKVSLLIKGNISVGHSATTDENGIASFKTSNLYLFDQSGGSLTMKQLEVGNHTVELSTEGNVKSDKVTTNLTILQANIKITVDNFKEYYGTDKKVKITVTNVNTGNVVPGVILHLYMPQTAGKDYYFQTNSNGTNEIAVSGLVGGTYDLTVSNNDTKNFNNTTTTTTITILQIPVKITANNVEIYFNSGTTATIKITDKSTGKAIAGAIILVQFDKDSKKTYLFQTNSKGQVSFSASLAVGKHTMTVSTADTRYSGSSVTRTITVQKASAKFTAKKVTDYYKGVKYFTVKLTNTKNKKAIYDAKVNIKVYISSTRYYNYNGNTGSNGQLRLALDSLKPGTYKVVVSGASSKNYSASKVTSKIVIKKAPAKLTPKKITAKKGAKKYFQIKVINKKTKKVIKGVKVKVKVYTGKKAKTYSVKTNSKGIAKLSTAKLKIGTHKVVVTSANKYVTAKQAKSTIKITK